jgi:hypothetical protein
LAQHTPAAQECTLKPGTVTTTGPDFSELLFAMKCETCGNDYDKAFTVTLEGEEHTFDSFECAISKLAPLCLHCGCRIIGHGVEAEGEMYCCAHCASHAGHPEMKDRS